MGILYERMEELNPISENGRRSGIKSVGPPSLIATWAEVMCFPMSTQKLFYRSELPLFNDYELLLGISNHVLKLPGEPEAWNNDLFALGKCSDEFVSIIVTEANERTFGENMENWFGEHPTDGQIERLAFLARKLDKKSTELKTLPINFLHSIACALLEAERFSTKHAIVFIHSYLRDHDYEDSLYEKFGRIANAFSVSPKKDRLLGPIYIHDKELYLSWISENK